MRIISTAGLVIITLILSFGGGYLLGTSKITPGDAASVQHNSILAMENTGGIVTDKTRLVLEQEYLRSHQIIPSTFKDREKLEGMNLDEIRQKYNSENGYTVRWEDDIITIRQTIDDWCPADKERCRLGEYQGRIAIFKGPDPDNDMLLRVTNIYLDILPDTIAQDIKSGKFEFENEQALNDALENLDEYL